MRKSTKFLQIPYCLCYMYVVSFTKSCINLTELSFKIGNQIIISNLMIKSMDQSVGLKISSKHAAIYTIEKF